MSDKNEKPERVVLKWKTSVVFIVCLKNIIPKITEYGIISLHTT